MLHLNVYFSMLNHCWGVQQTTSLSDAIKLSVFLACNKRLVKESNLVPEE
jgi:hypothetical protein